MEWWIIPATLITTFICGIVGAICGMLVGTWIYRRFDG